ncbi:MAG: glycosyltransferase family A protein [Thermoleophilia bacterium]
MSATITVVVPTRDRPRQLARCLRALEGAGVDGLEIVVVDDGSTRASEVAAAAAVAGARLVRLDGQGPAAARNAGARAATGDVVLFVDDDCVPAAGWASTLTAAVLRTSGVVVGGAVEVSADAGVWLRASEALALAAERGSGLVRTNNLGCRRTLLLDVPFDETFTAAAGEDRDWCVRVVRDGATLTREPAAIVEHRADLGARTFFWQQLRYGRAVYLLRRRGTHVPISIGAHLHALASGFREGAPVGLSIMAAQAATATGFVLEMGSRQAH